jgi:hypothetical protein
MRTAISAWKFTLEHYQLNWNKRIKNVVEGNVGILEEKKSKRFLLTPKGL